MNKYIFLCLLSVVNYSAMADDNNSSSSNLLDDYFNEGILSSITPKAPTAAAFDKYGSHPVDLSTGLVPISIPLYEISCGSLSVPITLSYHGGGIKVDEDASWVGLGWSLNFGGSITRTKNGHIDENEDWSNIQDASVITKKLTENDITTMRNCHLWSVGKLASQTFQPDVFSYNFGGHNGVYYLGEDNKSIVTSSYEPLAYNGLYFTASDGIEYWFKKSESTRITCSTGTVDEYPSAYFIHKIISPSKTDTISYTYQSSGNYSQNFPSQYAGYWTSPGILDGTSTEEYKITDQPQMIATKSSGSGHYTKTIKPECIYFRGGRVRFELGDSLFLNYNTTCKKLNKIIVETLLNSGSYSIIKTYQFYYSRDNQSRLLLDSVIVKGIDKECSICKLASFEYYSKPVYNKSIDYWGYNNGRSNSTRVPKTWVNEVLVGSADRTPNEDAMQNSIIKRITYPTGGSTEFVWEINRVFGNNSNYPVVPFKNSKTVTVDGQSLLCTKKVVILPDDDYDGTSQSGQASISIKSLYPQTITIDYTLTAKVANSNNHKKDLITITVGDTRLAALTNGTASLSKTISYSIDANKTYNFVLSKNCSNLSGSLTISYVDTNSSDSNAGSKKDGWKFTGLRIKEMKQMDIDGSILNVKKYSYVNPSGYCSGYLTSKFSQISNIKINDDVQLANIKINNNYQTYTYLKHNYMVCSDITLGPNDNQFAYEYVTESVYDGKTNKLLSRKTSHFNKAMDIQENTHTPIVSMSSLRNQLLELNEFGVKDDSCYLVRVTKNSYSTDSRINQTRKGFMVYTPYTGNIFTTGEGCKKFIDANGGGGGTMVYTPLNYSYSSLWSHLDSSKTIEYFGNDLSNATDSIVTDTKYTYGNENHAQATEIKMSRGNDIFITRMKYSGDTNDSAFIKASITNFPISKKLYQNISGAEVLQGGVKNVYNDKMLKSQVFKIYLNKSQEEDTICLYHYNYNKYGNLSEFYGLDGIHTSILWDKYNVRPVIVAKGMTIQKLSNYPNINSLTNAEKIDLFANSYFSKTLLQVYTYDSAGNLHSIEDPNGVIKYYKYDGFGRLISTQNQYKQTIQSFFYNYTQE